MSNFTILTEFLLMGFSDIRELQIVYWLFLHIYLVTLIGNLPIVAVTTLDRSLHTPMYFSLRNLDACYISVTVPKVSLNFLMNDMAISVAGCATQIFLVLFLSYVEFMLLTVMARDRYDAICQPLHYPMIMSSRVCMQMTLACLLTGLLYAGFQTGYTFRLPFCQSNVVHQFFCDIPSLLALSCADTFSNKILMAAFGLRVGVGCFAFIIHIFTTVLKFPGKEDQRKAFSTCIPHIIVVSVFLLSGLYEYLQPPSHSGYIKDLILSMIYSVIPPFLNPIIYSLRNKQIKEAVRIVMKRKPFKRNVYGYKYSQSNLAQRGINCIDFDPLISQLGLYLIEIKARGYDLPIQ